MSYNAQHDLRSYVPSCALEQQLLHEALERLNPDTAVSDVAMLIMGDEREERMGRLIVATWPIERQVEFYSAAPWLGC